MRRVYLDGRFQNVPVHDRATLALGQRLRGPVIIEERETTVFVLGGWTLEVRKDGTLAARRRSQ